VFNILNQTSVLENSCFYSSVLAEVVTIAILKYASFPQSAVWAEKLNLLNKSCFYLNNVQCQKLQQVSEVQSFSLDTGPQSFCYLFTALPIIRFRIQPRNLLFGCEVTTVVMETTQLVLSQFKNFYYIN